MTAPLGSTRYSYDFVRTNLPDQCRHILEIGCGRGELAAALQADGYQVLAIDSNPDAVAQANAKGVTALQMTWPAELNQEFDAILFTQSLHHITQLDAAVSAAVKARKRGGRIIVEDHRTEGGSPRSSAWFSSLVELLEAGGTFRGAFDVATALSKIRPDDHGHELHSSSALAAALERVGEVRRTDAAYYFRYLEPDFRNPIAAEKNLEHEIALIGAGAIDPLGIRFTVSAA